MPQDGTPIACPLAFGDGPYTVRIMRNTSGNNYVELCSADIDVAPTPEFAPFLRPNVYCSYTASSSGVAKAGEAGRRLREPRGLPYARSAPTSSTTVADDDDKAGEAQGFHRRHPRPGRDAAVGQRRLLRLRKPRRRHAAKSSGIPREDRHRHRLAAGHLPCVDHGEHRRHLAKRPLQRFPEHLVAHRPDLRSNGRAGRTSGTGTTTPTAMCILAARATKRSLPKPPRPVHSGTGVSGFFLKNRRERTSSPTICETITKRLNR